MVHRGKDGFTLIEVIVVAGIIAVLAGILVPLIFKEIDESRLSAAAADVRSISTALIVLKKDTGQWPVNATCTPGTTALHGAGNMPPLGGGVVGWDFGTPAEFDDYIATDANACWGAMWKGPYMATVTRDPWGNAYVVNADQFDIADSPVWVLSAGPDGEIDTPAGNAVIVSDDIGARLK